MLELQHGNGYNDEDTTKIKIKNITLIGDYGSDIYFKSRILELKKQGGYTAILEHLQGSYFDVDKINFNGFISFLKALKD